MLTLFKYGGVVFIDEERLLSENFLSSVSNLAISFVFIAKIKTMTVKESVEYVKIKNIERFFEAKLENIYPVLINWYTECKRYSESVAENKIGIPSSVQEGLDLLSDSMSDLEKNWDPLHDELSCEKLYPFDMDIQTLNQKYKEFQSTKG